MNDQPKPTGDPVYASEIAWKSDQLTTESKPTGEWTAETIRSLMDFIKPMTPSMEMSLGRVADAHNAQIAAAYQKGFVAERENYQDRIMRTNALLLGTRAQLADEREKYERSQEKLKAALMLLRHAKDSISTEDHVKMGLFLVRIRDSQIPEIAAIWKESDT